MSARRALRRLRRRFEPLADSPALLDAAAALFAARIRAWHRRIDWRVEGREALEAEVCGGQPVILAVWHGRLAMTPYMWLPEWGPVCSLTSSARPGRIVARTLARFGWQNAAMHDRRDNRGVSLQVARMIRSGTSIGIACDGPTGPALRMKTVPLDWSRLSGAPIWLWSYSVTHPRRLASWDRMILPRGRGRGVMLYRKWGETVPKRAGPDEIERLRLRLEDDLNALTAEADRETGLRDPLLPGAAPG